MRCSDTIQNQEPNTASNSLFQTPLDGAVTRQNGIDEPTLAQSTQPAPLKLAQFQSPSDPLVSVP